MVRASMSLEADQSGGTEGEAFLWTDTESWVAGAEEEELSEAMVDKLDSEWWG